MVVGLAQMHIEWENKEDNLIKLEEYLRDFSRDKGCDDGIILFPEMSLTGFSMNTDVTADRQRETVDICKKLAAKYNISMGVGWVSKENELAKNHYSIIAASGVEILDYVKIHPFAYSGEDKYFEGGNAIYTCKMGDFNVGVLICFDLRFPEVFQHLSDEAELIIVAANWPMARNMHWNTLLSARAIENQCYIAGVNCVGEIGGQKYSGDSALISPEGVRIIPVRTCEYADGGSLMIYNIDNNVKKIRDNFPVKSARRTDLYRTLM